MCTALQGYHMITALRGYDVCAAHPAMSTWSAPRALELPQMYSPLTGSTWLASKKHPSWHALKPRAAAVSHNLQPRPVTCCCVSKPAAASRKLHQHHASDHGAPGKRAAPRKQQPRPKALRPSNERPQSRQHAHITLIAREPRIQRQRSRGGRKHRQGRLHGGLKLRWFQMRDGLN
eukprot:362719-Chlamydomonas_euryale.AAC.3